MVVGGEDVVGGGVGEGIEGQGKEVARAASN